MSQTLRSASPTPACRTALADATSAAAMFAPATRHAPPRVCVVAEIGVNHDGSLERALELTEAAARAGADAVKLQLFDPHHLLSNQARLAGYQEGRTGRAEDGGDVYAMLERLRLDAEQLAAVRAAARRLGLLFILTPFSLEDIPALRRLEVDAVKIASPDAVNVPLLRQVAALGRPMIISSGTAHLEELQFVADLTRDRSLFRRGPIEACLMQCVSSYPTPAEDASLGAIPLLAKRFAMPIGYSDHTTEPATGALAVAAGACVIEKHLTYDRTAAGPDHAASFEPDDFADYVSLIRQAAAMHGPLAKTPRGVEADVRAASRQSVCLRRDLPMGHVLSRGDLTVKRPGTGVPARRLDEVIGRKLAQAVKGNDVLREEDLA